MNYILRITFPLCPCEEANVTYIYIKLHVLFVLFVISVFEQRATANSTSLAALFSAGLG